MLTLCDADTFETPKAVVSPRTTDKMSYAELEAALSASFDTKASEVYARCNFQQCNQLLGESNSVSQTTLKNLLADCDFVVTASVAVPAVEVAPSSEDSAAPFVCVEISVSARSTTLPMNIMLRDRFVRGTNDGMF